MTHIKHITAVGRCPVVHPTHGKLMWRSPIWSCYALLREAVEAVGPFAQRRCCEMNSAIIAGRWCHAFPRYGVFSKSGFPLRERVFIDLFLGVGSFLARGKFFSIRVHTTTPNFLSGHTLGISGNLLLAPEEHNSICISVCNSPSHLRCAPDTNLWPAYHEDYVDLHKCGCR